jgi:hypothetical protein
MRLRRSLLVVLAAMTLTVGITGFVSPHLRRYERSRRLDSLVLQATAPGESDVVDIGQTHQCCTAFL